MEMTGKFPYLYHTRGVSFLRKLYRLTKAPKSFGNMLSQFVPPVYLVKWVATEPDLFKPNWKTDRNTKSSLIILKTHLKIQLFQILREIFFTSDKCLNNLQTV
jgi:hypothetical protein